MELKGGFGEKAVAFSVQKDCKIAIHICHQSYTYNCRYLSSTTESIAFLSLMHISNSGDTEFERSI